VKKGIGYNVRLELITSRDLDHRLTEAAAFEARSKSSIVREAIERHLASKVSQRK
jgi:predicted DNA-binding protein